MVDQREQEHKATGKDIGQELHLLRRAVEALTMEMREQRISNLVLQAIRDLAAKVDAGQQAVIEAAVKASQAADDKDIAGMEDKIASESDKVHN